MNGGADLPAVRILLVDDHPLLREGVARMLSREPDLRVVGEAKDFPEAMSCLHRCDPDLVIVDLTLAIGNGVELIQSIRKLRSKLPVIVFTMHDDAFHAEEAFRAGANGYLSKYETPETLLKAVRQVLAGEVYVHESMVGALLRRAMAKGPTGDAEDTLCLSSREREVFRLLGKGMGTRQIAGQLGVSIRTVDTYRENIKHKLNLKNASELLQAAIHWAPKL